MKHRVLLVSDMHYTTEASHAEYKALCPTANASIAAGPAFGRTQREKIDLVTAAVLVEHAAAPLDAVLVLGDLSIDDYDFRNLPDNYCARFRDESMAAYPCPAYAIPGNHDSYPDKIWHELFGYGRQFSVFIGGALFVMLDTFAAVPASGASGSAYTPVNVDWLRGELAAHPDLPVFLCAHHIRETSESEAFAKLLRDEPRIVCLFRGHTHHNAVLDCYGKPLFDIGGYAYNGMQIDGKYTFGIFDFKWAWGYQMLEWDETEAHLRHVKPALHYEADNGSFDVPRTVSGERTIALEIPAFPRRKCLLSTAFSAIISSSTPAPAGAEGGHPFVPVDLCCSFRKRQDIMANIFDLFKQIETPRETSTAPITHLIVGLGNPGAEYAHTRHNAGFLSLEYLRQKENARIDRAKFKALVGECTIGGVRALLMLPQTFMNASGEAVREAADFYKIPPERIIVVCDDTNLEVGRLRVRGKGSDGGQRGMRSIIYQLGGDNIPRIKVGVGQKPHPDYNLADWVLSNFSSSEQKALFSAFPTVCDGITLLLQGKLDEAMQRCNGFRPEVEA